jgi:hypothetical protein
MYTFQLPPQQIHSQQAKLDHYKEQTDEILETTHDLLLAYNVASEYSQADAAYYLDMYCWLNSRYDYVMEYAMTFIPFNHATR